MSGKTGTHYICNTICTCDLPNAKKSPGGGTETRINTVQT